MSLLPHKRELVEFIPLAELYTTYRYHHRLEVFAEKGLECVACGRVGTFIIISKETDGYKQSRKRKSVGRLHVDVYTDDFTLMTVDHIVPKKVAKELGWNVLRRESLDNKQPMCEHCNGRKGHKEISNEELGRRSMQANWQRMKNGQLASINIIRELVPNIHRLNGDETRRVKTTA